MEIQKQKRREWWLKNKDQVNARRRAGRRKINEERELNDQNNEKTIEALVRKGDESSLEELLKMAMREKGFKTVIMPDGTEIPL
jgi:hypothetical protein